MPRYTRRTNRRRRRTTTRRKRRAAPTTRRIARISKRVALKQVETKRFTILNENYSILPINTNGTQWSARNVFSPLSEGVDSFNTIGNEIVNPMVKLKFSAMIDWNNVRSLNGLGSTIPGTVSVVLNVMIVAANDQYAYYQPTLLQPGGSNQGGWFYQADGARVTLNGNNVKVLKKWSIVKSPPSIIAGTQSTAIAGGTLVRGRMTYRWKRKITFEDLTTLPPANGGPDRSIITRGWNYYILVGWGLPPGFTLGTTPIRPIVDFGMDSYLYFKDP